MSGDGAITDGARISASALTVGAWGSANVLLGREVELRAAVGRLRAADVPLVTLTGREGSGRTSLGAAALDMVAPDLPGGVLVLSMQALAGRDGITAALATALHLGHAPGTSMEAALAQRLGQLATAVLFDDADERRDEVQLLLELLRPGGGRVLATARRPLELPGEHVIRVAPLGLPPVAATTSEEIERSPAVRLYLRQASTADHRFAPDASQLEAIAEVCRRLDGLPGAIELAAARVSVLSPRTFLRSLDRYPLEAGIRQGRRAEHRGTNAMGAAIASIHETLSPDAATVLRRLSILAGDAPLDGVEQVAADPDWEPARLLDAVTDLVDCHLLLTSGEVEPRFHLPVSVRTFARARLEAVDEVGLAAARRTAWCRQAVSGAGDRLESEAPVSSEDLIASLRWLLDAGDADGALTLAADCSPRWSRETWNPETRRLHEAALAMSADETPPSRTRIRADIWWARLSTERPDAPPPTEQGASFRALVELARGTPDRGLLLLALACQALAMPMTQDFSGAAAAVQEGATLSHEVGDPYWSTRFLYWSGMIAARFRDLPAAAALGAQGLSEALAVNDRSAIVPAALLLHGLRDAGLEPPPWTPSPDALLALARADEDRLAQGWVLAFMAQRAVDDDMPGDALERAMELLHVGQSSGAWTVCLIAIAVIAQVAMGRREWQVAGHLTGMFTRDLPLLLSVQIDEARARFTARLLDARMAAGPDAWDRWVEAGSRVGPTAAVQEARRWAASAQRSSTISEAQATPAASAAAERRTSVDGEEPLTTRETDVLRRIAEGDSNKDIARSLGMSPKTVMHHSMSIYRKLGVRGRSEATAWAFRSGLITRSADD